MPIKRLSLAAIFMAAALPASSQEVIGCDWQSRADNLVEPWEDNTRTFANGEIRVALLDTVEPAAAPFYLLVISPPRDELGLWQCRVVAAPGGMGFYAIEFDMMDPFYDPAKGLQLQMPAAVYDGEVPRAQVLTVTINQASGNIDVEMVLDPE